MENANKGNIEVVPKVKDLLDFTLDELTHKMGDIQPSSFVAKDGNTMNLRWNQIIMAVNYAAKEKLLSWDSTAREAFDKMARFLFPTLKE